jgi:two-component system cell cycle sensor histidine kinase/response regulator CckA
LELPSMIVSKKISIVTKTACMVSVLICFLIACLAITSKELVLSRFASLEKDDAKVQVRRVVNEITNSIDKLTSFGTDWAFWDDTYQFVVDGNSTYIVNNLMDETFVDQKLNFMMFYNEQDKLVYQRFFNYNTPEATAPDSSMVSVIQSLKQLFDHSANLDIRAGIVVTPSAPLLIVSAPILSSLREGPVHGTLLVGRYLDKKEFERISYQTNLTVALQPYSPRIRISPTLDSGKIQQGLAQFQARVVDEKTLVASTVLTDISGQPAVSILVTLGRAMYQQGYAMWKQQVISLLLAGLSILVFLIFLLNRFVLQKLVVLSDEVDRITNTGDATLRIEVQGNDEIANLGGRINSMLDTVQKLQTAQVENEKYLQNLLDTVNCGIMVVATTGKRKIVTINTVGATMLGQLPEDIVGKYCDQLVCDKNLHDWAILDHNEQVGTKELLIVRNDSSEIPVLNSIAKIEHGDEEYLIESFIDISELKKVEAGLRASEERYRQFFEEDLTGDFIVSVDGKIIECNLAYAQMFGYDSVDEIKRTNVSIQYPVGADRDLFLEKIRQDGKLEHYESELRKRDGSPLFCTGNEIGKFDENGKLIHIWGYLFDETKRVLLEKDIRQNQKLEAIGTLAGGIAHDFNNILTGIIGYTELIMLKEFTDAQVKEYLQKILVAGGKARLLILQILAFSRKTEATVQPVRLQAAMQEVMQLIRASLPATILIEEQIDFPATVLADPVQIHQILLNLCTNAGHAMQENGGILTVTLASAAPDKDLLGLTPSSAHWNYVRIRIGDTGHGIPEKIRDRIFDPFFTTKNKDEGTGLGLSMVHGIITSLKGQITFDSKVGVGTNFNIYLPLIDDVIDQTVTDVPIIAVGKEHIVYVDDEPFLVEIGREILLSLGYRVTEFTDSSQALIFLTEHHAEVDLVISDLTMPILTGIDLARSLRRNGVQAPMIIYTGYDEHLVKENLTDLGIQAVLLKPITYQLMAEKVRGVLDLRLAVNSGTKLR